MAELYTVLWRYRSLPAGNTDVPYKSKLWYYDAWNWAGQTLYKNKDEIISANSGEACSRADVVYALWQLSERPTFISSFLYFTDFDVVPVRFREALIWAEKQAIIRGDAGENGRRSDPASNCTRAQFITMLQRYDRLTKGMEEYSLLNRQIFELKASDVKRIFLVCTFREGDSVGVREIDIPMGSEDFQTILGCLNAFNAQYIFDRSHILGAPTRVIAIDTGDEELRIGCGYVNGISSLGLSRKDQHFSYSCENDVFKPVNQIFDRLGAME